MELIKNYLVKISKNEAYVTTANLSTTPECINATDLSFYASDEIGLLVNSSDIIEKKKKSPSNRQLPRPTFDKTNFTLKGNQLLKKRLNMYETNHNFPTVSSVLSQHQTTTTTTPINKTPTQSQLSVASTTKLHISVDTRKSGRKQKGLTITSEELKTNINRFMNNADPNSKHFNSQRNHTVINFDFGEINNSTNKLCILKKEQIVVNDDRNR
jgi:hypothetical protein